ncbi:MAG: bifunctional demethylmenaquinone methyltransferase/2-methoxy-6-polyprenyl-1,4-benzoquinol methylase UbiE [Candidatus Omnitrophica bacterium]|nr:bifunctional demethylmenaquinone methyltransferase/2-methoxy-6-polyprenyl-1,4-benzoquinol methylase UbiE [Candidatus Omnitrophota bacterium]
MSRDKYLSQLGRDERKACAPGSSADKKPEGACVAGVRKSDSPRLFNAIAKRYDLLNYILSFGMDIGWRRRLGTLLPAGKGLRVLDIATGTADVAIALARFQDNVGEVTGVDLAEEMLSLGRVKVERYELSGRIRLKKADALALPFQDKMFDAVTVSFGLRNMPDLVKALMEARRVLTDGGRIIVLEFSRPSNIFMRIFHAVYLLWFVPAIGCLLTGHLSAYGYLAKTVRDFPYGDRFKRIMRQVGFVNVSCVELAFGAATIYIAERQSKVRDARAS